jgi:hypothetical protein
LLFARLHGATIPVRRPKSIQKKRGRFWDAGTGMLQSMTSDRFGPQPAESSGVDSQRTTPRVCYVCSVAVAIIVTLSALTRASADASWYRATPGVKAFVSAEEGDAPVAACTIRKRSPATIFRFALSRGHIPEKPAGCTRGLLFARTGNGCSHSGCKEPARSQNAASRQVDAFGTGATASLG